VIRRYVLPIALPVLVIGGYVVSGGFGGFFDDAWEDFVGPFLITYWIGLGFTNAWGVVKESLHGAPPLVLAITGVVGA